MASSTNSGDTLAMSVRIQEVVLTGDSFTPTLRVGWLSDEFSVFSHWKRVRDSTDRDGNVTWKLGWKSSLVKWVSKSTETIAIVLFQKVGETESPVAKREIPCRQIINGKPDQKYKFRVLPLQELKGNVRGTLSGWVRCDEESEESSEFHNVYGMKVEKESTISHSTTFTHPSVDMSIDLTMEMPQEYYPFISDTDVFKTVFFKHISTLKQNQWIFGVILEYPNKLATGMILPERCPTDIFIELGMYKEEVGEGSDTHVPMWQASPRQVDFDALQIAAREVSSFF